MDRILELADNIVLINYKKLDRGHADRLVAMGQENRLDAEEIVQIIVQNDVMNGWVVTL